MSELDNVFAILRELPKQRRAEIAALFERHGENYLAMKIAISGRPKEFIRLRGRSSGEQFHLYKDLGE